jgi:intein/homing endonuclease
MKTIKAKEIKKGDLLALNYEILEVFSEPYRNEYNYWTILLRDGRTLHLGKTLDTEWNLISRTELNRSGNFTPDVKNMSKQMLLDYILFRASGINQAPGYTFVDFHREMVDLVNESKNLSCNDADGSRL